MPNSQEAESATTSLPSQSTSRHRLKISARPRASTSSITMLRSVWAEGSAKQPNEPVPGVALARSLDAVARPTGARGELPPSV
jgi:hypothetical protein